jgi:hypothetical protein
MLVLADAVTASTNVLGSPAERAMFCGPALPSTHGEKPLLATIGSTAGLPASDALTALPRHCQPTASAAGAALATTPHAVAHSAASHASRGFRPMLVPVSIWTSVK